MGNTEIANDLSSAIGAFYNVAKRLEVWCKELEAKEKALQEKEEKLNVKEKELVEKEAKLKETEERIKGHEVAVKKIDESAAKLGPVVKINIGGQHFKISKETLLKYKGSYFDTMITTPPDGKTFFIDRDPDYFRFLINYMRDGKLYESTVNMNGINMVRLREEFEYFQIPVPPLIPPLLYLEQSFIGGSLLSVDLKKLLMTWLPDKRFVLLYKATRDGFAAANFHAKCDIMGTLTVIQSQQGGWLFGGFTSQSWAHTEGYKDDPTAFIFTLTNPHAIPPTKYLPQNQNCIQCHSTYGPVFGGCDIRVPDNSNINNNIFCYFTFPTCYKDTTGKGNNTFTGERNFTTKEIEVFYVVPV